MDSVKLERGWLERQCQKAAEDVRQWPEWMKDAAMREREKENRRHARIAENHERWCGMVDGWVRVEERLPEPGEPVIVWTPPYRHTDVAKWDNRRNRWFDLDDCTYEREHFRVWRELPPPPSEEPSNG